MQKPEKIVQWLHVERKRRDPFVDHNGKPLFDYFIEIPYWMFKAYRPHYARVEIHSEPHSFNEMCEEFKASGGEEYLKKNWSKKMAKMYKMNNGYMMVATKAKGTGWFKSMEDYESYHKELAELNKKYGV